MKKLTGKKIVLGVTGSIAAYKAADLVSRLKKLSAEVRVVMTDSATRFVSPLTFQTLSGQSVVGEMFAAEPLDHIRLTGEADLLLVAPATANIMAKFAAGIADSFLTTAYLAADCPVMLGPAMNSRMWRHPATQRNLACLRERGVLLIDPEEGQLACGDTGPGKLASVERIIESVTGFFEVETGLPLKGKRVVVTAGPTREPIDPVRFLSNRSSGKMGYALAAQARKLGAAVTLISGPTALEAPAVLKLIRVETAAELAGAVKKHFPDTDILVMAAAVADFRPEFNREKQDKRNLQKLSLIPNEDILAGLGKRKKGKILAGFAAETGKDLARARKKLKSKHLDLIVFNDVLQEGAGFDCDTNIVTLLFRDGARRDLPLLPKTELAGRIWQEIINLNNSDDA
ncbi:MAG: bifunctional phosphopantothenoylcysteine decarboxylase/phosphopantothenate--cysteine ligase CoaBC [bacterium]